MNEKRWNGLWVDRGMKTSWLERLNAVKTIKITGTCAGHRNRPAWVHYEVPSDRHIVWALCHLGTFARVEAMAGDRKNYAVIVKPPAGGGFTYLSKAKWWSRVIRWLESWYS